MKKQIILYISIFGLTAYAGHVTHLGEANPKVRQIGQPAKKSHTLKPSKKPKITNIQETTKEITNAPIRTWTSMNGNKIKAKLIKLSSQAAEFKKTNGSIIKITRNKLSTKDKEYLDKYDKTGEFPSVSRTRKIIIVFFGSALFLIFATWFIKNDRRKSKYKAPKRNITIGTGI